MNNKQKRNKDKNKKGRKTVTISKAVESHACSHTVGGYVNFTTTLKTI